MDKKKTIALFGGSFDPPHIAHKAIVEALLDFKDVDKVVVMPTFLNPFKTISHASAKLRLKWLNEIFSDHKDVEVSSYEVDQNQKVPSIKTVTHFLKKYKKIYLVVGADNLSSLHKWDSYEKLKKLVSIIVVPRNNIEIDKKFFKLNLDIDVSSTSLRGNIDITKLPSQCAKECEKFYKEKNEK